MTIAKGLLAAAISLVGVTTATTASAAIVFKLNNVQFGDRSPVVGKLTTNDARTQILDFEFYTDQGEFRDFRNTSSQQDGYEYNPITASAYIDRNEVAFSNMLDGRLLVLTFDVLAGGDQVASGFEEVTKMRRQIVSGQIVSPAVAATPGAVPEPATWAMMMLGFGAMGATLRTRRRTAKIAFA